MSYCIFCLTPLPPCEPFREVLFVLFSLVLSFWCLTCSRSQYMFVEMEKFFFLFWSHHVACRIFPDQGLNLCPPTLEVQPCEPFRKVLFVLFSLLLNFWCLTCSRSQYMFVEMEKFFFLFWPHHVVCRIFPDQGLNLCPPTLEVQSLNH